MAEGRHEVTQDETTQYEAPQFRTRIGTSDATSISLLGQDVAADLMGQVGFGELAYWLASGRRPTAGQLRLFEAVLVSLADHGFTPTAIAARMTIYSAPESIQGAIAAGLLGGGSRFLGVTEDTGKFLHSIVSGLPDADRLSDDGWDDVARAAVQQSREAGTKLPGLGHPVHKASDPRTPVIYRIAEETSTLGPHLRLFAAIGRTHSEIIGRTLPLNGAGVAGAALADLQLPTALLRGFAILARTAGLIGHLAEEAINPVAPEIYKLVDRNAVYSPES